MNVQEQDRFYEMMTRLKANSNSRDADINGSEREYNDNRSA